MPVSCTVIETGARVAKQGMHPPKKQKAANKKNLVNVNED